MPVTERAGWFCPNSIFEALFVASPTQLLHPRSFTNPLLITQKRSRSLQLRLSLSCYSSEQVLSSTMQSKVSSLSSKDIFERTVQWTSRSCPWHHSVPKPALNCSGAPLFVRVLEQKDALRSVGMLVTEESRKCTQGFGNRHREGVSFSRTVHKERLNHEAKRLSCLATIVISSRFFEENAMKPTGFEEKVPSQDRTRRYRKKSICSRNIRQKTFFKALLLKHIDGENLPIDEMQAAT